MRAGQTRFAWERQLIRTDLPAPARLVGLIVAMYTDVTGDQGVWLSINDIARASGLSVNTASRYVRDLQAAGWIRLEGGARFLAWPGELGFGGQEPAPPVAGVARVAGDHAR